MRGSLELERAQTEEDDPALVSSPEKSTVKAETPVREEPLEKKPTTIKEVPDEESFEDYKLEEGKPDLDQVEPIEEKE